MNDNTNLIESSHGCTESNTPATNASKSASRNPLKNLYRKTKKRSRPESKASNLQLPLPVGAQPGGRNLKGVASPNHRRTVSNAERTYRDPQTGLSPLSVFGNTPPFDSFDPDIKGVARSQSFFQGG